MAKSTTPPPRPEQWPKAQAKRKPQAETYPLPAADQALPRQATSRQVSTLSRVSTGKSARATGLVCPAGCAARNCESPRGRQAMRCNSGAGSASAQASSCATAVAEIGPSAGRRRSLPSALASVNGRCSTRRGGSPNQPLIAAINPLWLRFRPAGSPRPQHLNPPSGRRGLLRPNPQHGSG